MSHACRLLGPFALIGILSGCSGGVNPNAPATVIGKVTYNGKTVPGGSLTFHGKEVVYPATIASDGSYLGRDFPTGELTVTIETESLNPARKSATAYGGKAKSGDKSQILSRPPPEGVTATPAEYVKIPAKYADKNTSGLTVTITSGKQTKNFELTD